MNDEIREMAVKIMNDCPVNDREKVEALTFAGIHKSLQAADNPIWCTTYHPGKRLFCPRCHANGERSIVEVYSTMHAKFTNGRLSWIDMPDFCDAFDPVCGWHGDVGECVIIEDNGED